MTGRPAALSGPLVVVNVDGAIATWVDGEFSGDSRIVGAAESAAIGRYEVEVVGRQLRANGHEPIGAVAALHAFRPWRTRVVEAPEEVLVQLSARETHLTVPAAGVGEERGPEPGLF